MSAAKKLLRVLPAGTHVDTAGNERVYSEADLRGIAERYDPALHEAPIVIGHPDMNAPAYGWLKNPIVAEHKGVPSLFVEEGQLNPAFAEMRDSGAYKKFSLALYPPNDPHNPTPGHLYIRHLGFLGATPPAIKGLGTVEFADAGESAIVVEFGEPNVNAIQRSFRAIRDWFLAEHGQEVADKILPDWMIESVEIEGPRYAEPTRKKEEHDMKSLLDFLQKHGVTAQGLAAGLNLEYAELAREVPEITVIAEDAATEKRRKDLEQREHQFAEREQKAARAGIETFVEEQVESGRLLPRHKDAMIAFMESLPAGGEIAFAEGDTQKKSAAADWFRGFLQELPEQITYAEVAAPGVEKKGPRYQAPAGYSVDPARADLHQRALAYAEQHKVDYIVAVQAVEHA